MNAAFFKLVHTDIIHAFTRVCALAGSCFGCTALVMAGESHSVTPRDANSSTVEWVETATDPTTGTVTQRTHSYVTLGNGLNYQDESGQWRHSEDLIELQPDGSAAALRGPHKLRLNPNLNTAAAISLTTASNRVFRSHPLALYYLNAETGERILVARVKDSIGELHAPNQVIYADCLEGAKADYRVTYTKAGMEADLIVRQVPGPEAFGFSSGSARLEWFTEFLDSPVPGKRERVLKREDDPARRAAMTEPDLVDEILDFQDLWLPTGRAFAWEGGPARDPSTPAEIHLDNAPGAPESVPTGKKWLKIDERDVLVESVDWTDIKGKLDGVSGVAAIDSSKLKTPESAQRKLPAAQVSRRETRSIQVAALPYRAKGLVLDYVAVIGPGAYTFSSGVTYLIGSGQFWGSTVTIEPNCVIKIANGAYLLAYSSIVCNGAGTYSIITSKDDNLYGEPIVGSTGNPTYAASTALYIYYIAYTSVSYLQIRWAQTGIQFDATPGQNWSHSAQSIKLQQCQTGINANGCIVYLSGVTTCGVTTPLSVANGGFFSGVTTSDCAGDADSDGLPDSWELQYFKTLAYNGAGDADGDGSSNLQEYLAGTNPVQPVVTIGEPLSASSRRTGLVISEIMYNPPTTGFTPPNNSEYVEIYNSEPTSKNIAAYGLVALDKNGQGVFQTTFAANTTILPGGFMLVATPGLDNDGGTIRLTNLWGAVLLEVEYSDDAPWPKQADGAGHSLVMVRPSYGENDPRAWGPSDLRGGSPGKGETYASEAARSVVINEFLANPTSGNFDFIELYNHGNASVDISGYYLSNDPNALNLFQIPAGTTISSGGFVSFLRTTMNEPGKFTFNLAASGDKIFFSNPSQTRVVDAVNFKAQRDGVSMGRYRDGTPIISELATSTAGAANSILYNPSAAIPQTEDIVINEIMYNPISGSDSDEYIELYNKGASSVTLTGWTLSGVGYTFPAISIGAGAYLVVAKNVANLRNKYPNLNPGNSVGDYPGNLSNSGERIALVNTSSVVIDEVTYGDGGRWGQWSDGGGSSLELIDPGSAARLGSDNRLAANWADSDESAKIVWTTVSVSGVLDNGASTADWLEVIMEGAGECLIDDVQVLDSVGGQRVVNPSFDAGSANWTFQGNHDKSVWQSNGGINNTGCLRVKATGRGDTGANRIFGTFNSPLTIGTSHTINAKVRWLKGRPEVLFRVHGNYVEAFASMSLPANLGTPGQQNSRYAANVGPAIFDVAHSPVLPAANQSVVVTARAYDPDNISGLTLFTGSIQRRRRGHLIRWPCWTAEPEMPSTGTACIARPLPDNPAVCSSRFMSRQAMFRA